MRFVSWNVNGIRAVLKKNFLEVFDAFNADIFAIQETKCQVGQVELDLPGYHQYWSAAEKKGYSGTAVFLSLIHISGAMVSGTLLPSLGFYATGYYFWGPLHALSAKVLLAALLVHIVLRTPAAASVLRRELARENER